METKTKTKKGEGRHELTFEERSKGGLTAWSRSAKEMLRGASIGGTKTGKIERTCPNCERRIIGPAFFRHLKKCNVQLDK